MNEIPFWQVLIMHAAPVITALAAWRSAARGAKTSQRNAESILVVHDLVNGRYAATLDELERVKAERDALRDLR